MIPDTPDVVKNSAPKRETHEQAAIRINNERISEAKQTITNVLYREAMKMEISKDVMKFIK